MDLGPDIEAPPDPVAGGGEVRFRAGGEVHVAALAGETLRRRVSDALRRTGDERGPSCNPEIHPPPPLSSPVPMFGPPSGTGAVPAPRRAGRPAAAAATVRDQLAPIRPPSLATRSRSAAGRHSSPCAF